MHINNQIQLHYEGLDKELAGNNSDPLVPSYLVECNNSYPPSDQFASSYPASPQTTFVEQKNAECWDQMMMDLLLTCVAVSVILALSSSKYKLIWFGMERRSNSTGSFFFMLQQTAVPHLLTVEQTIRSALQRVQPLQHHCDHHHSYNSHAPPLPPPPPPPINQTNPTTKQKTHLKKTL
jgi:hypothetical protein